MFVERRAPRPLDKLRDGQSAAVVEPRVARATSTMPSWASSAGIPSAAGEALTRLPPMVADSRIWSSANQTAMRGITGSAAMITGSSRNVGSRSPHRGAPARSPVSCVRSTRDTAMSIKVSMWTSPARPSRAHGRMSGRAGDEAISAAMPVHRQEGGVERRR